MKEPYTWPGSETVGIEVGVRFYLGLQAEGAGDWGDHASRSRGALESMPQLTQRKILFLDRLNQRWTHRQVR